MPTIPKTITPTQLRKTIYSVVREVAQKGHRYLVVPNEGDSVVICSREEYNELIADRELLQEHRAAEAEVANRRVRTSADVRRANSRRAKVRSGRRFE
jgi:PHD/YefM family antitoxin component YafN of YafNO toxin-antitoxin module